jgi:tetratricopeptide (TPR) repeat protein
MKRISFVLLIFFLLQSFLFSQNRNAQPRLEPDPKAFEFAQLGIARNYSWQEILDIALWSSGVKYSNGRNLPDEENLARTAIAVSGEKLINSNELPLNKNEQGEYLLDYMHRSFLRNYSEKQTRLDVLVNTGRFNCVSSAVLYTILASAIGLETNGVLTKDHAFVQVNIGTEIIDVETTTLYGYNPGSKKEFHDGFGNTTGFAYVTPGNYRGRSSISQLELVSLILTNRIADLESRGFFADAVGIAVDRAALLSMRKNPSDSNFFTDPNKDVMDRIFNYGASLIQAGKEDEALAWADVAENSYPDERWQDFVFTAMNNHLVKMIRAKKIADARIFLDMEASRLNPENYTKLETLVSDAELVQITSSVSTSEETEHALEVISRIENQGVIPAERIAELRIFVLLKESERRAKKSGWQDAIAYLESAVSKNDNLPEIEKALSVYKSNRAIELHNQFAELFNARKYEEAHQVVKNALQEFPDNRQLTSDLRMVENAMNRN